MYIDAPWLRSHRRSKRQVPFKLLPLLLLRSGFGCSYYWIQPQSDVWTFNPKGNAFAEEHSCLSAHRLKHHYLTLAKIVMHLLKLSWDRSVKKNLSPLAPPSVPTAICRNEPLCLEIDRAKERVKALSIMLVYVLLSSLALQENC